VLQEIEVDCEGLPPQGVLHLLSGGLRQRGAFRCETR
jgi:hypothetical protein